MSKPCICKITRSNNQIKSTIFRLYNKKNIRLDNAGEFTSQTFNNCCMSIGINIEHPVAHVYTQNILAESFIKRLQLIARPLPMRARLSLLDAFTDTKKVIKSYTLAANALSKIEIPIQQVTTINELAL